MKRLNFCRFIISVILIMVILGMAFFKVDQELPETARILVSSSTAVLAQDGNQFNRTGNSGEAYGECLIVPRNLSAGFNYGFSEKHSLPVWGKVAAPKPTNNQGFFFAAMVLLLFSRFYQRSRTSSEDDGGSRRVSS